jgi:hypothetical protein
LALLLGDALPSIRLATCISHGLGNGRTAERKDPFIYPTHARCATPSSYSSVLTLGPLAKRKNYLAGLCSAFGLFTARFHHINHFVLCFWYIFTTFGTGVAVDQRDPTGSNWKKLFEAAVVESNIPKFIEAVSEAQKAIAQRAEVLRNVNSVIALSESDELEMAARLLSDMLEAVKGG